MDIETIKKLISRYKAGHNNLENQTVTARRYYLRKNDIMDSGTQTRPGIDHVLHVMDIVERPSGPDPLRKADNRIASNFYNILVNQKASYLFAKPPVFDVDVEAANEAVQDTLGDGFAKVCKDLCIDASNASVGWLHVWTDANSVFHYAVVDAQQVIPIWSDDVEKRLVAVLRMYSQIQDDGSSLDIYEYWDEMQCHAFYKKGNDTLAGLKEYDEFSSTSDVSVDYDSTSVFFHNWGEVPFIPFFNNNTNTNDLTGVKSLIDAYDKVYSGFLNDLEDVQEVIFLLTGYNGQDLEGFLEDLKLYKTVKLDSDADGGGDLRTLTIDIPVEARDKMLTMTRKAIFEQGQGIDPDPANFGNSSGVALSYLYSLLELKSGLMETEFRLGFGRLVRLICKHLGVKPKQVAQTWTRTSVRNDTELAAIAQQSVGIISTETIVRNHPWVTDPEAEMERLEDEKDDTSVNAETDFQIGPNNQQGAQGDAVTDNGDTNDNA